MKAVRIVNLGSRELEQLLQIVKNVKSVKSEKRSCYNNKYRLFLKDNVNRQLKRLQRLDNQRIRSVCNMHVTTVRAAFQYRVHSDYINSMHVQIGSMNKMCNHCNTEKWKDEAPGMCCAGSKHSSSQYWSTRYTPIVFHWFT